MLNKENILTSAFTPREGDRKKYKFRCSICYSFFSNVLECSKCENYICVYDLEKYLLPEIRENKKSICPFCSSTPVVFRDVDPTEEKIRHYFSSSESSSEIISRTSSYYKSSISEEVKELPKNKFEAMKYDNFDEFKKEDMKVNIAIDHPTFDYKANVFERRMNKRSKQKTLTREEIKKFPFVESSIKRFPTLKNSPERSKDKLLNSTEVQSMRASSILSKTSRKEKLKRSIISLDNSENFSEDYKQFNESVRNFQMTPGKISLKNSSNISVKRRELNILQTPQSRKKLIQPQFTTSPKEMRYESVKKVMRNSMESIKRNSKYATYRSGSKHKILKKNIIIPYVRGASLKEGKKNNRFKKINYGKYRNGYGIGLRKLKASQECRPKRVILN